MPFASSPVERERCIAELEREARYRRERYRLYLAKTYGPRTTNPERLRKLKQASELAEDRLRRARRPG